MDTEDFSPRADWRAFSNDVALMRRTLQDELGAGGAVAARSLEGALRGAARSGQSGFEELGRAAVRALAGAAAEALKLRMLGAEAGGDGGGAGGMAAFATALLGAPGRATGGLVSPGRPYRVGERGPEWFVPASAGTVQPTPTPVTVGARGAMQVTVNVAASREAGGGAFMQRTGAQVARAVARAVERAR